MTLHIKPIITVHINTTGEKQDLVSLKSSHLALDIQSQIEGIHKATPVTINTLWKKYNSLVEDAHFASVRDFVAALAVLAKEYLPGIHFYIHTTDVGYTLSASSGNQKNSGNSIRLLQEWLCTGIATAIKTKLKIIAMQYDYKTGIFNDSMIHKVWDNSNSSLIFFDINQFKRINDSVSYAAGDDILKRFAKILKGDKETRGSNYPIRYGGDEFLVIMENATLESILEYATNVERLFSKIPGSYGVSYGYFLRRPDNVYTTFNKAYILADEHMKSKKSGEGKLYRIQQSIEGLSPEEKLQILLPIIQTMTREQVDILVESKKDL